MLEMQEGQLSLLKHTICTQTGKRVFYWYSQSRSLLANYKLWERAEMCRPSVLTECLILLCLSQSGQAGPIVIISLLPPADCWYLVVDWSVTPEIFVPNRWRVIWMCVNIQTRTQSVWYMATIARVVRHRCPTKTSSSHSTERSN